LPTPQNLAAKTINNLTPEQLRDFSKGYLHGTHLLDGFPSCDLVNDNMISVLRQMILSFQNINSIKDVTKLKELLPGLKSLLGLLITQAPSCASKGSQIKEVFTRLMAHLSKTTYLASLGLHVAGNIPKLFVMVSDYMVNFDNRNAYDNGFKAGEFLKFLMFWDF